MPPLNIDDFGLKPLRPPADEDLHELIAERYVRASTVVTSNLDFAEWDVQIALHARESSAAQRALALCGVGVLTASAFAATVPEPKLFAQGRQLGAWLGLTPRQASSGGRTRLGASSARGDAYLRTLLIQGARSTLQAALRVAPHKASALQRWILALHARRGYHKTLVAIANKHARILWAMSVHERPFDPNASAKARSGAAIGSSVLAAGAH